MFVNRVSQQDHNPSCWRASLSWLLLPSCHDLFIGYHSRSLVRHIYDTTGHPRFPLSIRYNDALSHQPKHDIIPYDIAKPVSVVLFAIGQLLVISSTWALGITGQYIQSKFRLWILTSFDRNVFGRLLWHSYGSPGGRFPLQPLPRPDVQWLDDVFLRPCSLVRKISYRSRHSSYHGM